MAKEPGGGSAATVAPLPSAAGVPEANPEATAMMQKIAEGYEWIPRGDGLYWAPWDCLAPPPPPAFMSAAASGDHARKVYHLFVQDPGGYASATEGSLPEAPQAGTHGRQPPHTLPVAPKETPDAAGFPWKVFRETEQVIVKEAWVPTLCADDSNRGEMVQGKRYCLKTRGPLFIMARPKDPKVPSDHGWIYGAAVAGKVTGAGLIPSCVGCHARAPHDRLFGLPRDR